MFVTRPWRLFVWHFTPASSQPHPRGLGLLAAAFLCVLLSHCRLPESTAELAANERFHIAGTFALESSPLPENGQFHANLILPKTATRQSIANFRIDRASGAFSFSVSAAEIDTDITASLPVSWASMGGLSPSSLTADEQSGQKVLGYLRFEILYHADELKPGSLPYYQALVPVTRSFAFGKDNSEIVLRGPAGGPLTLATVGVQTIRVTDESDAPVAAATVVGVPLKDSEPLLISDEPTYGAVSTATGQDGTALLYPLPIQASGSGYQVIAARDGYCRHVTAPTQLPAKAEAPLTIVLKTCSTLADDAGVKFTVRFAGDVNVGKLPGDPENAPEKAFVSAAELWLELTPESQAMRGFKVVLHEGEGQGGLVLQELVFPTFVSVAKIPTPPQVSDDAGGVEPFTIAIQPLFNADDRRRFGEPEWRLLYAAKSVSEPSLAPERVTVLSSVGVPGVISGRVAAAFSVKVAGCPFGATIAVALNDASQEDDLSFASCATTPVAFTVGPNDFSEAAVGGYHTIRYFMRDLYGNINRGDALRGTNKLKVFIDYGVPDLEAQPLLFGADFGIVARASADGDEGSADDFVESLTLSPANIADYALRFANTESCRLPNPSLGDGVSESVDLGRRISFVGIAKTSQTPPRTFSKCGDPIPLTTDVFAFDSEANVGRFFLTIKDLAGHVSSPHPYTIPRCDGDSTICWSE